MQKVGSSLCAGGLGSCIATPCDLVLVRMQADARPGIPDSERRNYKGVFNAFNRIVTDEGMRALYTGAVATMMRAMVMNCFMLVSYDTSKENLRRRMPDASDRKVAMYSSLVSSVFTCCGTLPFDNIKTKVQNQKADVHGVKPYSGIPDCF
jgi:solute carrier family 25 oxoglutarate transporter 11